MKSLRIIGVSLAAFAAAALVSAAEKAKEVTLTGAGQCAKCSLGKTESCQNAIVVKQDGKDVTYLLTANDVSKAFHKNVCEETKQIKVTGVVKEENGQKEITPSKIELVKS